ncbi:MAG: hypothetical protein WC758_07915 [Candidatus Woesearchaeota archaeon]|jgi:hypothetical protein
MKLKNILLTIPLALSISCATLDKNKLNSLENVGMLVQNCSLINEDIRLTKVGTTQFGVGEANPIAKIFVDDKRWNELYIYSTGAMILGSYLSYKVDKTGLLAKVVNGTIALAEVFAISMWINLDYSNYEVANKKWKENTSNKNRYVEIFRWDY